MHSEQTPPQGRIKYSVNNDLKDKASQYEFVLLNHRMQPVEGTVADLIRHVKNGYPFCNAYLRETDKEGFAKRSVENFGEAWLIGADIDNTTGEGNAKRRKADNEGYYSLDDALRDEEVIKKAAFLYTTPSHSKDHHRFRIVWVLPEPIYDPIQYRKVVSAFIERFGGDPACSSPAQVFYGSSEGIFHEFGNVLSTYALETVQKRTETIHHEARRMAVDTTRELNEDDVRSMLSAIKEAGRVSYNDWVRIIASTVAIVGEAKAERLIEEWEPGTEGEVRYKIQKRLKHVNPGTLVYLAKKAGWEPPPGLYKDPSDKKKRDPQAAKRYLSAFYKWRKNVVTHYVECLPAGTTDWEPVTDYVMNSILEDISEAGLSLSRERFTQIVDSSFSPEYNPLRQYFETLPPWDGEDRFGDLVQSLSYDRTIYTTREEIDGFYQYAKMILQRWFRGAVVGATRNQANHLMPVLQGGQGIGKTRFLNSLCPPALHKYLYIGPLGDDKDARARMGRAFIGIDDELESMTRKETGAIKSLLTQDVITLRLPYGRYDVQIKRTASFIGSVNRREFLNDETGSRRFPVIALGNHVDMNHRDGISTDALWAQAAHEVANGERHWVDGTEIDEIMKRNEEFTLTSDADDLLMKYYEVPVSDMAGAIMKTMLSTTEVAMAIQKMVATEYGGDARLSVSSKFIYQLGRALRHRGFQQSRIKGRRGWLVKVKPEKTHLLNAVS